MPPERRWFEPGFYDPQVFGGAALFVSTTVRTATVPGGDEHALAHDALTYLARLAFARQCQLIVRAQPVVVLLLLAEAQRFARPGPLPVVVAFDEAADPAPRELLDLGSWDRAALVNAPGSSSDVRSHVLRYPNLAATVFISGNDNCLDDAAELRRIRPDLPLYPVASTGGVAPLVFDRVTAVGRHNGAELRRVLRDVVSYPLVMRTIFAELTAGSGRAATP